MYTIHKIEIEKEFKARTGFLCRWCPYQYLCPKRKDRAGPESLPPARLEECLNALSEKIHRIKESITSDLEKKGVLIDLDGPEETISEVLNRNDLASGPLNEAIREYRFLLNTRIGYLKILERGNDRV